jgi:hypothetical protein
MAMNGSNARTKSVWSAWKSLFVCVLVVFGRAGSGSGQSGRGNVTEEPAAGVVRGIRIGSNGVNVLPSIRLAGARNEWLGFAVEVDGRELSRVRGVALRMNSPIPRVNQAGREPASERDIAARGRAPLAAPEFGVTVGQLVDVPADLNRASYVRHVGSIDVATRKLPRAILPISVSQNRIDLAMLRDAEGVEPQQDRAAGMSARFVPGRSTGVIRLWVDLRVPLTAVPGEYVGEIEVLDARGRVVAGGLRYSLSVYDFVLPDRRNLQMLGDVTWDRLGVHFSGAFEAVTPRLMRRDDARYVRSIAILDAIVQTAQQHRVNVWIDRLQPLVKWRAGQPPDVDWRGFDSITSGWLDGGAFADREPLGPWPLPRVDQLASYTQSAQQQYLREAAAHFDALDTLARMPFWIDAPQVTAESRANQARSILADAALALASHPRLRVLLPLEEERLSYAETEGADRPARSQADRMVTLAAGLVSASPMRRAALDGPPGAVTSGSSVNAVASVGGRLTYLDARHGALVPYAGAGASEADVRVWAFLAFLRGSNVIRFGSTLPGAESLEIAADPDELTWFYPGSWFGVEGPVPSLPLKWLRRAQQDFEYLTLARERGERINALLMARLLTKPVELLPAQDADPMYALMSGTIDPNAWDAAMVLLARLIELRPPGASMNEKDRNALNIDTLRWMEPIEKPLLLGRSTIIAPSNEDPNRIDLRVGIDLYNASDATPADNALRFAEVPAGWRVNPEPVAVPPLATYRVARYALAATVEPARLDVTTGANVGVEFTHGFTRRTTVSRLRVPIAISRRREGNLQIDGALGDWTIDDAMHQGPLVRMLDRPSVLSHTARPTSTSASIFSAWSEGHFYLAFKVTGLSDDRTARRQNFVRYDARRAWGEDLVQILAQPVYTDGTLGPVLVVSCKPNGGQWSERKLDLREGEGAWEPLESGVRYACRVDPVSARSSPPNNRNEVASDALDWRGELAIPWRALDQAMAGDPSRRPVLIRFNFAHHHDATASTGTWAGPVDHGRDELFTGALIIRELEGIDEVPAR